MTDSPLHALVIENTLLKEEISRLRKNNFFLDIISSDNFDIIANNLHKNNQPTTIDNIRIGDKVRFIYKNTAYIGLISNIDSPTKIGVDVTEHGITTHWNCRPKSLEIIHK